MYGAFAEPSPPLVLTQDLREIAGRTPLALLPFQLLGDNNQERKSKAGRNSYSSFPISKMFSQLIP